MINGKFVSYKTAFASLLNDHPWVAGNYTEEDLLRSVRETIRLVGGPSIYVPKVELLEVKNSMTDIPSDAYYINSLGVTSYTTIEEAEIAMCAGTFKFTRMKYNGDEMLRKMFCSSADFHCKSNASYILTSNKILPNFGHGIIIISFLSHMVDDEGLPMIPDNESWNKAVVYTTLERIANRMLMTNKMTDNNYNRIEQNKLWYTAQASNTSKEMNPDQRISMKNASISWPMNAYAEADFFSTFNRTRTL